jgi:hypothetical protein
MTGTATPITNNHRRAIQLGRIQGLIACCAAAPGALMIGSFALPPGSGTLPVSGTTASGFGVLLRLSSGLLVSEFPFFQEGGLIS